jgi:hypothetical protein
LLDLINPSCFASASRDHGWKEEDFLVDSFNTLWVGNWSAKHFWQSYYDIDLPHVHGHITAPIDASPSPDV